MAKQIVWTKRASINFNNTVSYLETEWGNGVTENFVTQTFKIVELLSEYPEMGSIENDINNIRGILISKHNRLFYRTTRTQLIVLNIFDTRKHPNKKL